MLTNLKIVYDDETGTHQCHLYSKGMNGLEAPLDGDFDITGDIVMEFVLKPEGEQE